MVHTCHEKREKPEKQVTFVKSHEKSHEKFKKPTKVMKVAMKKKNLPLVQFLNLFSINCTSFYYHCYFYFSIYIV